MARTKLDMAFIRKRMKELGSPSQTELSKRCGLSRWTIQRAFADGEIVTENLGELAKALKCEPEELLPVSTIARAERAQADIVAPWDWKIEQPLTPFLEAPNGVSYCIAKLVSTKHPRTFSRGKLYHLVRCHKASQEVLHTRLTRHCDVCERIDSPNVARHRTIISMDKEIAWWVLDTWIDGKRLDEFLEENVLISAEQIAFIGSEILAGLKALHSHGVVMRELAPERVYVQGDLRRCVLTDFEMAKILDKGTLSVRPDGDWIVNNSYRALEVVDFQIGSTSITSAFRYDIYSWGKIIAELFQHCTDDLKNHREINDLIDRCIAIPPSKRPANVEEVQMEWLSWTKRVCDA